MTKRIRYRDMTEEEKKKYHSDYNRAYREKHSEKILENCRKYHAENRERINKAARRRYQENIEGYRQYALEYSRARAAEKRAKKKKEESDV